MSTKSIQETLSDPAASYWLKQALEAAMKRDPVDAANDAEHLSGLLSERASEFLSGGHSHPDESRTSTAP